MNINLTIKRALVNVGNQVFVAVHVRNVGDLEGSYTVQLKANRTVVDEKTVTLGGGAKRQPSPSKYIYQRRDL